MVEKWLLLMIKVYTEWFGILVFCITGLAGMVKK
jgi:hypothetical protein